MSSLLGTLGVNLNADTSQLEKSLASASRSLDGIGERMTSVAKRAAVAFAGMSAAIGGLIKASGTQAAAEAKLAAAIRGTQQEIDPQRIKDFAAALQEVTTFGDEATIEAGALLASFNLTEDAVIALLPAVQDLAALMGTDLKTNAIAVGKALTVGASALTRYGVVLTDAEKKSFDMASATERAAMLVRILQKNTGPAARLLGQTGAGAVTKFTNAFGDLAEALGSVLEIAIVPFFQKLTAGVNKVIAFVQALSPQTRSLASRFVLVTTALTGATGLVAGFGALIIGMKSSILLATKLALVFGAIPAAIAAIVGAVRTLSDVLKFEEGDFLPSIDEDAVAAARERLGIGEDTGFGEAFAKSAADSLVRGIEPLAAAFKGALGDLGKEISDAADAAAQQQEAALARLAGSGGAGAGGAGAGFDFGGDEGEGALGEGLVVDAFDFAGEEVEELAQTFANLSNEINESGTETGGTLDTLAGNAGAAGRILKAGMGPGGLGGALAQLGLEVLLQSEGFQSLMESINSIIPALAQLLDVTKPVIDLFSKSFSFLASLISRVADAIKGFIEDLTGGLIRYSDEQTRATTAVREFTGTVRDFSGALASAFEGLVGQLSGLDSILGGALVGLGGALDTTVITRLNERQLGELAEAIRAQIEDLEDQLVLTQDGREGRILEAQIANLTDALGDVTTRADEMSESIKETGDQLTNVPDFFKVAAAEAAAINPDSFSPPDPITPAVGGGAPGAPSPAETLVGQMDALPQNFAQAMAEVMESSPQVRVSRMIVQTETPSEFVEQVNRQSRWGGVVSGNPTRTPIGPTGSIVIQGDGGGGETITSGF